MQEEFKPVPQFENRYQVSNLGRVQRIDLPEPKLLGINRDRLGVPTILLCQDNRRLVLQLRTLVGRIWIPNPNNWSYVRNKSANLEDCSVSNLYWAKHYRGDPNEVV